MQQESAIEKKEENISIHIFSVSAAMVGVCLTVVGILNVITTFTKLHNAIDEITALDAAIFMGACIFSYMAIRTGNKRKKFLLEKIADVIFLTGLALMVIICLFVVRTLA